MKPEPRLNIGDAGPAISVIDSDSKEIAIASLWANGPTILTFLRHFG
jgi:hypothetical protein